MKSPSLAIAAGILLLTGLVAPASASAAPEWHLSTSAPDRIAPGGTSVYVISLRNVGDTASDGGGSLDIDLPAGITGLSFTRNPISSVDPGDPPNDWSCEDPSGAGSVHCDLQAAIVPGAEAEPQGLFFEVAADPLAAPGPRSASFTASGGGAPALATATEDTLLSLVPNYGVAGFDGSVTADPDGDAYTHAAGHPYAASTTINFNTRTNPVDGDFWPDRPIKDVFVDVPPGLIGNPTVASTCSLDQLVSDQDHNFQSLCSPASQIGLATLTTPFSFPVGARSLPLYSMLAPPDAPARFAFILAGTVVILDAELRGGGDYGLSVNARNASEGLPVIGTSLTLWGTPAATAHTPERACPDQPPPPDGESCEAGVPVQAFLRLPTSCQGPLPTTLHTDSWFEPGPFNADGTPDLSDPAWKQASFLSHLPPGLADDPYPANFLAPDFPGLPVDRWGPPQGVTDCAQVPFEPEISLKPTTNQADSPTGLEVDLSVPQDELTDPLAIAQSDLRDARVTLPAGIGVNPASANGQGACTLAQIDLHHQNTEPTCPDASKIGTVTVETPLLEESLAGSVYLAKQGDNPFNSLLALYIVAAARGQIVKLAGHVETAPDGRLLTTFSDQPQLPFSHLHLELRSGPRAPLRTPPTCGTYASTATLTPWSGNAPVELESSFQITSGPNGQPCPEGAFDPHLSGGSENPVAGAFTPFHLRLTREDGTRELSGLSATLPPGLAARFSGIPYCPQAALASVSETEGTAAAQIASPSCPAASLLGTVSAGAGAGPSPFYLSTGRAYLAGPYKGAPLSLAVITPALAGPFDLGSVLVRSALFVDPTTAQGRAVSDPLPTALHGIGLDLRDLRIDLDRPQFTLNPTSCDPLSIEADISGAGGTSAHRSQRFQVANCGDLGFKPRLRLGLKGGTNRGDNPRFSATLTFPAKGAQANIARAAVTLPHSEFLDQGHIRTVCTRVQFAADACPKGSIYGHAKAITPLLDQPLEGPVFLRSSSHKLPDLVASLDGQIHIDLVGRIDTARTGGIRNTFEVVPDAPVSKFTLTMKGGRKGLLQNSTDLCAGKHRAIAKFDGQNGRIRDFRPVVRADCAQKKRRR